MNKKTEDGKGVKDTMKENTLNEAPASATARVKSPNGFSYLFTLREETGTELLGKLETFEKYVLGKGWSADNDSYRGGGSFNKPQVPTKPCPVHAQELMKERTSAKTGEKYFSHSRGTYPNLQYCNGSGFPGERMPQQPQIVGQTDYPERQVDQGEF